MVWDISPIAFSIGNFQVRYYSLFFAWSYFGGLQLCRWQILRTGRNQKAVDGIFWWMAPSILLGSRMAHVIFYEGDLLLREPWQLLVFWHGGLASHGAMVGMIVACIGWGRQNNMTFMQVGDLFSFAGTFGLSWIRLGNLFNSEIVGKVTSVPWCLRFPRYGPDAHFSLAELPCRHPTQLYEFAYSIAGFGLVLALDKKFGVNRPTGLLLGVGAGWYFLCRFWVEFFKVDQARVTAGSVLTMGQYLSIPFILLCSFWIYKGLSNYRLAK